MELSDLNFLLRFLPLFLVVYYFCPIKYRNALLFASSLLFYLFCGWENTLLLLCSLTVNYVLIRLMDRSPRNTARRRSWFLLALFCNIALLCYFKYGASSLPPGISFYTFTMLSADIDVYLHRESAPRKATEFGVFGILFPKLLSGPIVQFKDMAGQIRRRATSVRKAEQGLSLVILGLAFKVLLADTLGILWHDIRTIGFESISTPLAWMGAAAYSAQLLFDFQGYSLMALGLASMLGFELPKNFDHPYRARSISEYYRRWHISLGQWFRDYLYIPLGGNRLGLVRTCLNFLAVWAVTGIWHGTSVNFLLWGMLLGLFIVLEKCFLGSILAKHRILSRVYVWFLIPLTWIIFAVTDLSDLGTYFLRLFPFRGNGIAVNARDWISRGKAYLPFFLAALAVSCPLADRLWEKYWNRLWMKILLCLLFWVCVYQIANGLHNPFLYRNF